MYRALLERKPNSALLLFQRTIESNMEETLTDWQEFIARLNGLKEGIQVPVRFDNRLFCCWTSYHSVTQEYRCYQKGTGFQSQTKYVSSLRRAIRQLETWKEEHIQELQPAIARSLSFYGILSKSPHSPHRDAITESQQLKLF